MRWEWVLVLCGLAAQGGRAAETEIGFSRRPAAARTGNRVAVTFTVEKPCDATVTVEKADGRIVRHLASGVLGENPPAPFQANSLTQKLVWDGKDDAGEPVNVDDKTVRVRLGLTTSYDRLVAPKRPFGLGWVIYLGMAVDGKHNIYVLGCHGIAGQAGRTEVRLVKVTPEGEYVRTIMPFDAETDPAEMPGVDFLRKDEKTVTPRVYERVATSILPQFHALARQTMVITRDDRLVMISGWQTENHGFGPRSLLMLNADGTVPRSRPNGPILVDGVAGGYAHVALSPDEETAYVTGLARGRHGRPKNVVYRVGLDVDAQAKVLFGEPGKAGGGKTRLQNPRGIATDGDGNIYVSDFGNDRVVVLSPKGEYKREFPADGPGVLAVHPKTRAVYLAITAKKENRNALLKFADGARTGKPVWQHEFGGQSADRVHYHPSITLDWRADPPRVYVGANNAWCPFRLLRYLDKGDEFEMTKVIGRAANRTGGNVQNVIGVTSDDTIYFKQRRGVGTNAMSWKMDGATGERAKWWAGYYDNVRLGRDGMVYEYEKTGKEWDAPMVLHRRTTESKRVAYAGGAKATESFRHLWPGRRDDLFVRPDSTLYVLAYLVRPGGKTEVHRIGPDGKIGATLLKGLPAPASLKVDRQGNLYVCDNLKPRGRFWPKAVDQFISGLPDDGQDQYAESYGSVLKFGPEGGAVRRLRKGDRPAAGEVVLDMAKGEQQYAVKGLLDAFVGISPRPPIRRGFRARCWCLDSSIALDRHDRLFVPDSARFMVHVLDTNFNEITTFGGFDTLDSPGGPANAPGPNVPLECPTSVHVSDAAAYVVDSAPCAGRMLRVKLEYAADESCTIPEAN